MKLVHLLHLAVASCVFTSRCVADTTTASNTPNLSSEKMSSSRAPIAPQRIKSAAWRLSGKEILFELMDPKGEYKPGIYAWDPSKPIVGSPTFQLLVAGGHRPVWSPRKKRFAYVLNGSIWIADTEGNSAAMSPAVPPQLQAGSDAPVRWDLRGNLYCIVRSEGWGSTVFLNGITEQQSIAEIREAYSSLFQSGEGFWPVIPLKNKMELGETQLGSEIPWSDVLTTNNAAFSPSSSSGAYMATESYPASPTDLRRNESRILIYNLAPKYSKLKDERHKQLQENRRWFAFAGWPEIKGPGKRLTNLGANTIEITPLWSPSNKWVALTVINTKEAYMVPAIIAPDGKALTYLVTKKKESWGVFIPDSDWLPVVNIEEADMTPPDAEQEWGNVHRTAVKWSSDGKYLWMKRGQLGLFAARFQDNKWTMRQAAQSTGSDFGITISAFNGPEAAWVEDTLDRRKISSLNLFNVETNKFTTVNLKPSLQVLWMDW